MTTTERAIETYGKDMQLNVAIEELSELIKEICKHKRGRDNRENIIEELCDCYIMMEQIEIIFDISGEELVEMYTDKLNRLEKRLAERSENGK
jgi:NTP pyrophosphatase (non-canonical NTP hydrolase)